MKFSFNAFPWKRLIGWSGVQGDYPQQLAEQASPTIILADLERDEYGFLAGVSQGSIGASVGPVAGQFGFVQVNGPNSPSQLVIIDWVWLRTVGVTGVLVQLYLGTAVAAGAAFGAITRDDRQAASFAVNGISGTSAAPAGLPPANTQAFGAAAGQGLLLRGPWMLSGILSLNAVCNTVNTQLDVVVGFRARPLQKGER